jgi:TPR repeat protein
MTKLSPTFIGGLLLCLGVLAPSTGGGASPDDFSDPRRSEQKHFLECLAVVYSPAFWFSYNDSLYFQTKNEAQAHQLEAMKAARSKYLVLTNREARYELAAKGIAASGIGESWQRKILLPFSTTNQDLTPTLGRPLRILPRYKVLQSLAEGDALLQDDQATYFVMDFGRGAEDVSGTNALLIKEGVKSYSEGTDFRTVEAFANASLSKEEKVVLTRVAAAFQKQAASLAQEIASPKAAQEFEDCKARATDSNPYMEFLLAKCYLEGKGTEKDEKLAMEWMNKAAKSGSGDAISYLEKSGRKAP